MSDDRYPVIGQYLRAAFKECSQRGAKGAGLIDQVYSFLYSQRQSSDPNDENVALGCTEHYMYARSERVKNSLSNFFMEPYALGYEALKMVASPGTYIYQKTTGKRIWTDTSLTSIMCAYYGKDHGGVDSKLLKQNPNAVILPYWGDVFN